MKRRCVWYAGIVLLLLLAFGLRAWDVGRADLTFDEVATYFVAHRSPLDVIRYVMSATREHPPLYYLGISLWCKIAGTSEFVLRYPSVLIGVLTVALGIQMGRRLLDPESGWWTGVLLATLPFAIWAGRTGRMYALMLLIALAIMNSWQRWIQRPTAGRWAVFIGTSLIGALTHYYLILLWAAQALLLIVLPGRTRCIRWRWLSAVVAAAGIVAIGVWSSPGIRASVWEILSRFPYRGLRIADLKLLVMDLYLYWHYHTLLPIALAGLGLTCLGWGWSWRKSPAAGALLAAWGLVPTVIIIFIPEALQPRYFTAVFPALALGLGAALRYLRPKWLRGILLILVLTQIGVRCQRIFLPPDTTFSEQIALLRALSRSDDALIMNGPWPALLLNYYPAPTELPLYPIPEAAPPGFDANIDISRLEAIAQTHERLWVSYGAVRESDPRYQASRWLAEHTYHVLERHNRYLYLTPPATLLPAARDIELGERLRLQEAALDRTEARAGDFIRARLTWEGRNLNWSIAVQLLLIGPDGQVWNQRAFNLGPMYHDEFQDLPSPWVENCGLWIQPGTPPGVYTLALHVEGDGIALPDAQTWLPLQTILVRANTLPDMAVYTLYLPLVVKNTDNAIPRQTASAPGIPSFGNGYFIFGNTVALIGIEAEANTIFPSYPLNISVWWQALTEQEEKQPQVSIRLRGPRAMPVQTFPLGPDFYASTQWASYEIVKQQLSYLLPRDTPPGVYHLQIQLAETPDAIWQVKGQRKSETFQEYLSGKQAASAGEWADVLVFRVKARPRAYTPPLFRTRTDARFGDILRCRGFKLTRANLRPGESTILTAYWQAMTPPPQTYAVFNHVLNADGGFITGSDSWPQAGVYTTERWVQGEVIAETYTIVIPADTPPGTYTLYTGVYDPQTGARLTARDAKGQPYLNDAAPLGVIQVTP